MSQRHILLSSGSNARGQLGNGSADDSHFFQRCMFDGCPPFHLPTQTTRIVDLVTGANHTIVLLELSDGVGYKREIWGTGDGNKGQLGCFSSQDTDHPLQTSSFFRKIELPLLEAGLEGYSVKLIGATWETSYVVLSCEGKDDVVISMGSDDYGDLGIGGLQPKNRVFNIVDFEQLFNKTGSEAKRDRLVVNSLTTGQRHIILELRLIFRGKPSFDQAIVGWGISRHGQLGVASLLKQRSLPFTSTPQIIAVSRPLDPVIATSLGMHHSIFLHASGHLTALGSDRKAQLQIVANVEDARGVKCTWNGTYCIVRDGSAWSVLSSGSNTHGQLGYEESPGRVSFSSTINTTDTSVQIACGSEHVLALIKSRDDIPTSQIWGWGWNEHGNLGLDNTEDARVPVRIWPLGVGISVDVSGIWGGCGTSWIHCEYRC